MLLAVTTCPPTQSRDEDEGLLRCCDSLPLDKTCFAIGRVLCRHLGHVKVINAKHSKGTPYTAQHQGRAAIRPSVGGRSLILKQGCCRGFPVHTSRLTAGKRNRLVENQFSSLGTVTVCSTTFERQFGGRASSLSARGFDACLHTHQHHVSLAG